MTTSMIDSMGAGFSNPACVLMVVNCSEIMSIMKNKEQVKEHAP